MDILLLVSALVPLRQLIENTCFWCIVVVISNIPLQLNSYIKSKFPSGLVIISVSGSFFTEKSIKISIVV